MPLCSVPPSISDAERSSTTSDIIAQEGDTVTLWCMSSGTPTPQVTWYQCSRLIRHACSSATDTAGLSTRPRSKPFNVACFPVAVCNTVVFVYMRQHNNSCVTVCTPMFITRIKVIWEKAESQFTQLFVCIRHRTDSLAAICNLHVLAAGSTPNLPFSWEGGSGPHLTQCVIGPHKCICQMASKSVERLKQGARM